MISDFVIRSATTEDRSEVLEFTRNTWEYGDYIQWVYDDWVTDASGSFLVAVERASARIAAIDKLTLRRQSEVWFEGLRVHPDFRGRGLSGMLQRHMIDESRRLGAKVIRFLTLVNNTPVHKIAYRDGFSTRFVVRHWDLSLQEAPVDGARSLRNAAPAEAPSLFAWWQRTASFQATDGLIANEWSYWSSDAAEWMDLAAQGLLLVPENTRVEDLVLPPPMVIVRLRTDEQGHLVWTLRLVCASGAEWRDCMPALVATARARGIARIRGLLPDAMLIGAALKVAGLEPDRDDECLALFSLRLQ